MKKIGIVGGTSPESTVSYYLRITHEYTRRFGDYGYPEIIIYSVSFQEFVDWTTEGNWTAVEEKLAEAFDSLAAGGADMGLIAANTPHRVFDEVAARIPIPLVHIVDATADAISAAGLTRVGLLGTRQTMSGQWYSKRLEKRGIATIVPVVSTQDEISRVIYEELGSGIIRAESKAYYLKAIEDLVDQGAQGVILGCTEIPFLISQSDVAVAVFDTATIHADAALAVALD